MAEKSSHALPKDFAGAREDARHHADLTVFFPGHQAF